jgi:hypothetical protein
VSVKHCGCMELISKENRLAYAYSLVHGDRMLKTIFFLHLAASWLQGRDITNSLLAAPNLEGF